MHTHLQLLTLNITLTQQNNKIHERIQQEYIIGADNARWQGGSKHFNSVLRQLAIDIEITLVTDHLPILIYSLLKSKLYTHTLLQLCASSTVSKMMEINTISRCVNK